VEVLNSGIKAWFHSVGILGQKLFMMLDQRRGEFHT